jgi:hypothetical protein
MVALRIALICMLGFVLIFGVTGCGDDEDARRTIEVCNGDDEEYLKEIYDLDRCDKWS